MNPQSDLSRRQRTSARTKDVLVIAAVLGLILFLVGWLLAARPSSVGEWAAFLFASFLAGASLTFVSSKKGPKGRKEPAITKVLGGGVAALALTAALAPVFQGADAETKAELAPSSAESTAHTPTSTSSRAGSQRDLTLTLGAGAQAAYVYNFPLNPKEFGTPPSPKGEGGCAAKERHEWAIAEGGLPVNHEIYVTIESTSPNTHVILGKVNVHSRRLPGQYKTYFPPCPEDLFIGGRPDSRFISVGLSESPETVILDEDSEVIKTLEIALKKGDEGGQLTIAASVDEEGIAYEWWLELTATSNGVRQTYRLPKTGWFKTAGKPPHGKVWSDIPRPHVCSVDEGTCSSDNE